LASRGAAQTFRLKPVFATLEQGLILGQLGSLASDDRIALQQAIVEIIG